MKQKPKLRDLGIPDRSRRGGCQKVEASFWDMQLIRELYLDKPEMGELE
jgi:hypothetical protein